MTQIPTATVVQAIAALESMSATEDPFYMTWQEFAVLRERARQAAASLAAAMKANKEGA